MEEKTINEKLEGVVDENASLLVGELLRNLEVLDGEGLSFKQVKSIFKKLIREKIYQNARYLKKLIGINLDVGTIQFREGIQKE